MRTTILCLALLLSSPVALAQAYKCKTPNGSVFQSEPCSTGNTLRSATDYVSPAQHRQAVAAQEEVWRQLDKKAQAAMLQYQLQEQQRQQHLAQQRAAAFENARRQELLDRQLAARSPKTFESDDDNRPNQLIDSRSGTAMQRGAGGYIDPRNGTFYQDAAGGVVNTRTGRFSPTTP